MHKMTLERIPSLFFCHYLLKHGFECPDTDFPIASTVALESPTLTITGRNSYVKYTCMLTCFFTDFPNLRLAKVGSFGKKGWILTLVPEDLRIYVTSGVYKILGRSVPELSLDPEFVTLVSSRISSGQQNLRFRWTNDIQMILSYFRTSKKFMTP